MSLAVVSQGERGLAGPEGQRGDKGEPGQRGEKVRNHWMMMMMVLCHTLYMQMILCHSHRGLQGQEGPVCLDLKERRESE